MTDRLTCKGTTSRGTPCRMTVNLGPTGLCYVHDPDRREEWREIARQGQAAAMLARQENARQRAALLELTAGPRPPVGHDIESLTEFHRWIIEAAARGELDHTQTRTLSGGVRIQLQAIEKRDLTRQVAELEKRLKVLVNENRRLKSGSR